MREQALALSYFLYPIFFYNLGRFSENIDKIKLNYAKY